jgi:AcrR family transcriptional regulator
VTAKQTAQICPALPSVQKRGPRPTKSRAPTQDRARETQQACIDAAEQLLVEVGYAAASTNAVARRAGVSIGSLYQYFDDKDAVFRAVVNRHRAEMHPLIADTLSLMDDPKKDLLEVTLALLRQMAEVHARNPRLMRALQSELGWLEHDEHEETAILERVQPIVEARTSACPKRALVVAHLMVTTVNHLARWMVHGRPRELDEAQCIAGIGRMLEALLGEPGHALQ